MGALLSSTLWQSPVTEKEQKTTINDLDHDILRRIFAFLDFVQLIRCSAVSKSWSIVIDELKLLQMQYHKQQQADPLSLAESSSCSGRSINSHLEQLAFEHHRSSLQKGPVDVVQWKGHSVGIYQCQMKKGLILTGGGDKVMRLWSADSYSCLDEFALPDGVPLIDFDFDEGKVVGLVGTHIYVWTRSWRRNVFSSRDGLFAKGLCMRYIDPEVVVGCENGKVRVFDLFSGKFSQIIEMHYGPVTCLSFNEDQLLVSGSSSGSISLSDLASDRQVTMLKSTGSSGIHTLSLNSRAHILFAGSRNGIASSWDLRMLRRLWEIRVCPNLLYSIGHLKNDTSALVIGGIDGVLRVVDQDTGDELSMCVVDEPSGVSNCSKGQDQVIERKKVRRLAEYERYDFLPMLRPQITCLSVGMQKVVTTHNEEYISVWGFSNS